MLSQNQDPLPWGRDDIIEHPFYCSYLNLSCSQALSERERAGLIWLHGDFYKGCQIDPASPLNMLSHFFADATYFLSWESNNFFPECFPKKWSLTSCLIISFRMRIANAMEFMTNETSDQTSWTVRTNPAKSSETNNGKRTCVSDIMTLNLGKKWDDYFHVNFDQFNKSQ